MPRQIIPGFGSRTYQPGAYTIDPTTVGAGFTSISLELARAEWTDPTSTINMKFERSFDSGQTWEAAGSFTAKGGVITDPSGNVAPVSSAVFFLPHPESVTRQIRGELTVTGPALKTEGFVVFDTDIMAAAQS